MKKLSIIFLLFFTASLVGCYEDKGNYDYKDIQKIDIKFDKKDSYIKTTINQLIEIDPILSLDIDETTKNYSFAWYLNGETKEEWAKKKFVWKVDRIFADAPLILAITDKRNNLVYMQKTSISVTGPYETNYSWMILSDEGGKSLLSYLSVIETEDKEDNSQLWIKKSDFFRDVYTTVNDNQELGRGPIAIQEHFRVEVDYDDNVVGNVAIFQESGAVDLNGVTFEKEIDFFQSFDGGQYPAGVILRPGSFMDQVDVVTDQEGKLYSRIKATAKVYHSEYFLHTPLKVEGETEILEKCVVARGFYRSNRYGVAMIYDGKNKRMLSIANSETAAYPLDPLSGAGKITPLGAAEDGADLSKIIPLNDMSGYELLYLKIHAYGDTYAYGNYLVLKQESTGKLFLEDFATDKPWGKPARYITKVECTELIGLPTTPSVIAFPTYLEQQYAFFACGKVLYIYDLLNKLKGIDVYYTFDSNITAMNYESNDNLHLAVGLENGDFYVMGVNEAKNIKDEHKVIYKAPEKVGRIVDIKYKEINHWNY